MGLSMGRTQSKPDSKGKWVTKAKLTDKKGKSATLDTKQIKDLVYKHQVK
jgi:hypothetical protein